MWRGSKCLPRLKCPKGSLKKLKWKLFFSTHEEESLIAKGWWLEVLELLTPSTQTMYTLIISALHKPPESILHEVLAYGSDLSFHFLWGGVSRGPFSVVVVENEHDKNRNFFEMVGNKGRNPFSCSSFWVVEECLDTSFITHSQWLSRELPCCSCTEGNQISF